MVLRLVLSETLSELATQTNEVDQMEIDCSLYEIMLDVKETRGGPRNHPQSPLSFIRRLIYNRALLSSDCSAAVGSFPKNNLFYL
jgi:hypothetical protein